MVVLMSDGVFGRFSEPFRFLPPLIIERLSREQPSLSGLGPRLVHIKDNTGCDGFCPYGHGDDASVIAVLAGENPAPDV